MACELLSPIGLRSKNTKACVLLRRRNQAQPALNMVVGMKVPARASLFAGAKSEVWPMTPTTPFLARPKPLQ